MKNKVIKILSAVIAAAMIASIAGCSNTIGPVDFPAEERTSSSDANVTDDFSAEERAPSRNTIYEFAEFLPNTVVTETRTTDVIYFGDKTYYELSAHQISSIHENNSEHYTDLTPGDIVRVNAEIRSETVNFGVAGGTVTLTFEKIYSLEIVTDEYYRDNDFGAITVGKDITLSEDEDRILRYNGWKYMYNADKGCYVTVIAAFGNGIAFENGKKAAEFDRFIKFPFKGFDWLMLVNDDISVAEIEAGLNKGDYSKFYLLSKTAPAYAYIWGTPESNLKNVTIDCIYRGSGTFVATDKNVVDEIGFYHLDTFTLTEFTDCSDYKIGEFFRINVDFIHQGLRDQGGLDNRFIDTLYSIEKITPEYGNGNEEGITRFAPSQPLDESTYMSFIGRYGQLYCYNTDTGKYVLIVLVPATSEYPSYYSIFEDGEHAGDFSRKETFDNEKTNMRHVVFVHYRSGDRILTVDDIERKLKDGDFSQIYYIGAGNLDVLFPDY